MPTQCPLRLPLIGHHHPDNLALRCALCHVHCLRINVQRDPTVRMSQKLRQISSSLGSKRFDGIDSSGAAGRQIACQCRCSDQCNRYGYERDRIERTDAKQ